MDKRTLQNTDRFRDPLGEHMKSAQEIQKRRLDTYPDVKEVYASHYVEFTPNGEVGEQFLGSSDGVIGTELALGLEGEQLGFFSYDGRFIAKLEDAVLRKALEQGWNVRCFLAYSTFNAPTKSISGAAACFCYDNALGKEASEALEVYIKNVIGRIAHREYLRLALEQEQFIKVLESKGQWYLIKEEPWPKLAKGTVYYRRRRTFNDRLIDAANRGNKGCLVASWLGMFIALAGIGLLIWYFFFR
jgi:hypothetical protein